jgi:hypothetical protein
MFLCGFGSGLRFDTRAMIPVEIQMRDKGSIFVNAEGRIMLFKTFR